MIADIVGDKPGPLAHTIETIETCELEVKISILSRFETEIERNWFDISQSMLYFSSIGGQMVTQNIVVVPTYGGFIAEVSKVEVLQCK